MSLVTSIAASTADCKNLTIRETTGVYNATTNPGGYGSPNPLLSSATAIGLTVKVPSGATYNFTSLTGLPTNNTTFEYLINYSSLGMTSGLVDGEYDITYVIIVIQIVDAVPITIPYTVTLKTYITCNLKCCIDKMLTNISDWDCDCNNKTKEDYLTAFSIYQQIQHSIECGDLTTANNNIKLANRLCSNLNCSTCK